MVDEDVDIPGETLIVMDLEWIGDSSVPVTTHLVQMAFYTPASDSAFSVDIAPLAVTHHTGVRTVVALQSWLHWIEEQGAGDIILIAHNGIRFDAPVLLNALQRCGLSVPSNVYVMDSLYHIRHHLRYRVARSMKYDIDSLCTYCGIDNDQARRHTAVYDVEVLHDILVTLASDGIPFISGVKVPLGVLSTILVHGIGPVVAAALPVAGLMGLCDAILCDHPDLSTASCMSYLNSTGLRDGLPLCDTPTIAKSIAPAAARYLQYWDANG